MKKPTALSITSINITELLALNYSLGNGSVWYVQFMIQNTLTTGQHEYIHPTRSVYRTDIAATDKTASHRFIPVTKENNKHPCKSISKNRPLHSITMYVKLEHMRHQRTMNILERSEQMLINKERAWHYPVLPWCSTYSTLNQSYTDIWLID